ncbi:glycine oxidase ThiO [Planosporangium flavigriseum]|uniref:glycine oxidase n=1 Tax=Planosporangium flavigriseum TaxID=373681 RepID=A0A8J3LWR8_9ACTN|nr:glycine oxidase ThiO [Planosporangium flavigriseum]NJC63237.1 glycine oxidase ThiO [Planosporangium flavigriseum]GIG72510.1 glycine oxidase ThiO [Planosporangium flavigriseum]
MTTRVAVVGGGIIGLAVAWRCVQRGLDVTVFDASDEKATTVAAGMLAPAAEIHAGEEEVQRLLADSAGRWPQFAAELEKATGIEVGYRDEGTLLVALTDDDLREVRRLCGVYERAGQPVHELTARELREREPLLSPRVRGGAYAPQDHQVDPRRVLTALRTALKGRVVTEMVTDLAGVDADVTVVAAGVGTRALTGLPVRPVKGQTVRVTAPQPPLRHIIRGYARNRPVYLVPRRDGELVIGATEEERGFDTSITVGAVLDLLRPAAELLPEVVEYPVSEIAVGLRPGTPDNAPILGALKGDIADSGHGRILVASGHYRNGVLLTPLTADLVAELVTSGVSPQGITPFAPDREALWT